MAEPTAPSAIAGNVYSEAQHFSLVKSAVEQETASITREKSELAAQVETLTSEKAALATELAEAKTRMDVLESDKVAAEAAAETAKKSFEDFKAELQRKADVEAKKGERKDRVKAANESLSDAYFTDERVTRWAQMSDEDFDGLVGELAEFAAAAKGDGNDSEDDGDEDDKSTAKGKKKTAEKAAASKAFTGGETASETDSEHSTLRGLLMARRTA